VELGINHLVYRPKGNAEQFAKAVYAASPVLDPQDEGDYRHGGLFASIKLGEGAMTRINTVDDTKKT